MASSSSSPSWAASASSSGGGADGEEMEDDGGIIMEDTDNNILMGEESSSAAVGGGATGGVTSVEDQLGLLQQQLSCLRTNDKDVLVAQLEKIIGPSLNSYAAHFFLDMNNWNVQLAVGSYFDLIGGTQQPQQQSIPQQQQQPPPPASPLLQPSSHQLSPPPLLRGTTSSYRMRVKGSVPESEDRSAGPSVVCLQFGTGGVRQELRVMLENNGDVPWPTGTHLRFVSGNANVNKPIIQNNNNNNNVFCDDAAAAAPVDAVLLSSPPGHLVKPGEEVEVTLVLDIPRIRRSSSGPPPPAAAPPAAAGHLMYEIQMIWRLCTSEGLLFATPDEMIAASSAPGAPPAAGAGTAPVMFRLFVETVDDSDPSDESLSGRMRLLST